MISFILFDLEITDLACDDNKWWHMCWPHSHPRRVAGGTLKTLHFQLISLSGCLIRA